MEKEKMNAKTIFTSKTVWLALAQGVLGVVVAIGTTVPTVGWLMIVKSILDVIIRLITVEPITI